MEMNSMEKIIKEEMGDFKCKRCGQCCKREGLMASAFEEGDWVKIIAYLHSKSIKLKCACCNESWKGSIESLDQIINSKNAYLQGDLKNGSLYDFLDRSYCFFLKYRVLNKKREYFCEIEHIKPIACAAFKCEDSKENSFHEFEKRKDRIKEIIILNEENPHVEIKVLKIPPKSLNPFANKKVKLIESTTPLKSLNPFATKKVKIPEALTKKGNKINLK